MIPPNTIGMGDLGVFGGTVADEMGVGPGGMSDLAAAIGAATFGG